MLSVAHNIQAMNSQRQYSIVTDSKAKSAEKLASGYRINRAADDAAGLAISEKMRRMIRGLNQGTQNAQDGVSWTQIGDGSLNEVDDILHRMKELTIKALNETNNDEDRSYMQAEFDNLQSEIDRITHTTEFNNKLPDIEYWLFQFIPKAVKLEQIVRQATECGVSVIVPIIGEYSEKNSVNALEGAKKERLDRIIREARQQSGSPVDTKILAPVSLEEAVGRWKDFCSDSQNESVAFVLSERDDCNDNLRDVVNKTASIKKVAIAVGSEGGISPDEVALLQEKGLFYPIHFAVNILRCETAALYGIAAVQSAIN